MVDLGDLGQKNFFTLFTYGKDLVMCDNISILKKS